jgi:oligopeptide/dipeptide ABC transporter ATP-binding protein
MSIPALKVSELSVCLGNAKTQRKLVDRVSFIIQPGSATGLVGESGCGKTLTALAMLGLLPAGAKIECKSIALNGREISGLDDRQRRAVLGNDIAMVFQQPGTALDPVFKLGQQIGSVYRRHRRANRAQTRQATLESLASVGFSQPQEIAEAFPHQLSGGMRQLAMIAMATVCKPSVIIADEPTTALDAGIRSLVLQQLNKLRERFNTALLLISHDLAVVRQVCDDALVMYCGRVLEQAPCAELFSHPRHPYTAGLLACIPLIDADEALPIKAIPGQVPAVSYLPPGCHFAPRCERAEEQCQQSAPVSDADATHQVACFRPLS